MTAWAISLWLACTTATTTVEADTTASDQVGAQCDVCGMMVSEQPAPRGQLVYRDGTRAHFCSVGDLRASLEAPSPHGSPLSLYVEALPADFDPASNLVSTFPWVAAEDAGYVFGATRPLVMGTPVLTYADPAAAAHAAEQHGLHAYSWESVRAAPFNQSPQESP
jgi:copper chaperone NosL